jgi:hypothetical protein
MLLVPLHTGRSLAIYFWAWNERPRKTSSKIVRIFTYQQRHNGVRLLERLHQSRTLFNWVLRLKRLEMEYDIILHVIHVSGRRMILGGTDGTLVEITPRELWWAD